jgi:hypothetical protein
MKSDGHLEKIFPSRENVGMGLDIDIKICYLIYVIRNQSNSSERQNEQQ